MHPAEDLWRSAILRRGRILAVGGRFGQAQHKRAGVGVVGRFNLGRHVRGQQGRSAGHTAVHAPNPAARNRRPCARSGRGGDAHESTRAGSDTQAACRRRNRVRAFAGPAVRWDQAVHGIQRCVGHIRNTGLCSVVRTARAAGEVDASRRARPCRSDAGRGCRHRPAPRRSLFRSLHWQPLPGWCGGDVGALLGSCQTGVTLHPRAVGEYGHAARGVARKRPARRG